ncbi:hypothetical protein [Sphingomonas sp. BK580]|uniref:hypothetical protein n=1 Tax=Sphingomonas sp. BK580 TaxID=2586972 RepID=UPI0016086A16|nr:hypothetical protein [Sphingomonas sp. BK580]MBB3692170.1 hypothetical protein [Sphingomonas sp. BK580]
MLSSRYHRCITRLIARVIERTLTGFPHRTPIIAETGSVMVQRISSGPETQLVSAPS